MNKENIIQIILGFVFGFILLLIITFSGHFFWLYSTFFYLIILSISFLLSKIYKKYKILYLTMGISTIIIFFVFISIIGNDFFF